MQSKSCNEVIDDKNLLYKQKAPLSIYIAILKYICYILLHKNIFKSTSRSGQLLKVEIKFMLLILAFAIAGKIAGSMLSPQREFPIVEMINFADHVNPGTTPMINVPQHDLETPSPA